MYLYLLLRLRQCLFIDFLILIQRDSVNLHRHGRHHIRWFPLHDKAIHLFYIYLIIRYNISSDKFTTPFFIKGLHGGILNARELTYNALHFL